MIKRRLYTIILVLMILVLTFGMIYVSVTHLYGKQILLLRSGISQSNVLYEKKMGNLYAVIYHKNNHWGIINTSSGNHGSYNSLILSYHKYDIDYKTGKVYITRGIRTYKDAKSIDARKQNTLYQSVYTYESGLATPSGRYVFFGIRHDNGPLRSTEGTVIKPLYKSKLNDNAYIFLAVSDSKLE